MNDYEYRQLLRALERIADRLENLKYHMPCCFFVNVAAIVWLLKLIHIF
jgi:hypothetical protein